MSDLQQLDKLLKDIEKLESYFRYLPAFRYGDKVFMTGQEWYERFVAELKERPMMEGQYDVFAIAKRASGVDKSEL